jgi:hypothetical protein
VELPDSPCNCDSPARVHTQGGFVVIEYSRYLLYLRPEHALQVAGGLMDAADRVIEGTQAQASASADEPVQVDPGRYTEESE